MTLNSPNMRKNTRCKPRTIRPIGVSALQGLAEFGDHLLAVDRLRGFLLKIDPKTDNTTVINPRQTLEFTDATGLAIWEDTLWFTRYNAVYFCPGVILGNSVGNLEPQLFAELPYEVSGIAVWDSTIYLACDRVGYILVYSRNTGTEITRFYAPGIGTENLTVRDEELWICDKEEQTVYCLERATGTTQFSVLTPFTSPSGLAFYTDPETQEKVLYVAYAGDELYIRDNPSSHEQFDLAKRDRTFIHPLYFHFNEKDCYATSNGYLIEMSYVEELEPLDEFHLEDLEWSIALPSNTNRQKVLEISPIGLPFEIQEEEGGERVAVFKFKPITSQDRLIFGWKALLEVRSIKYQLHPRQVERLAPLPPGFAEKYLIDDGHLAMDTPIVKESAQSAIRNETNFLRQLLSIRNYVYDQLSYSLTSKIENPDVVLRRGVGSCGEYVGVLLALARLNKIACRTIGRYKCPAFPDRFGVPLEPEYNHVWLEFYIPGFGWVPMESNPDDINEGGPYPLRFFMGLAWYHIEIGKGIRFQSLTTQSGTIDREKVSIGTLAINHVRFTILDELPAE